MPATGPPDGSASYLSPPDVGADERALLLDAFDSNWIAPLGPHVDAFEREFADGGRCPDAAALSSGTAALHLALLMLGVGPGDEVLVPTLTFVATANAVAYVGARPVFVDSDEATWNLDPELLDDVLAERAAAGRLPGGGHHASTSTGSAPTTSRSSPSCARARRAGDRGRGRGARRDLPRDAARARFGAIGVFSFNGNKIITTSGGGMLVSNERGRASNGRATCRRQARDPAPHYEHSEIGFNYRMSNLLAAVGRRTAAGRCLPKVARRRAIKRRYRDAFAGVDGIGFMPDAPHG